MDDLLTREAIAAMFNVVPGSVQNWVNRGRRGWTAAPFPEPAAKDGRRYLWRREDVEAWAFATGRLPLAAIHLGDLLDRSEAFVA